jgi:hypothetical protein
VIGFCPLYGEVGVLESRVAEAEPEFVLRGDVVGDEMLVVDVYAFGEVVCEDGRSVQECFDHFNEGTYLV